ncbi:acyl-CoA dehydrogenase family protein [Rhizobiaceae bacterium BDR2-2]|uniref:Acyl-CoA dehydrogenase family protein n=1 Tax=Ectorhizobium quercum TaxID=2965071 RepID=A0AAE3MYD4_9HYPH|nr:acyl-CoA dehydrogenase family protein [Ectorhizobium quercum]MCX8997488.1 acyl-CoA dehydrogenase family protein [Ectorhizobium quercum]
MLARDFAATLLPDAVEREASGRPLRAEYHAWARTGLLTLTVPKERGGSGLSYPELSEMIQIVAAADGALAQTAQSHFGTIEALRSFGTPGQRAFFFDRILAFETFGNAQAEAGQRDQGLPATRLTTDGAEYRLNGTKLYTTGSFNGDWIRASAQDDEGRFVFAILPRDTEGVHFEDDWHHFGQKGTASRSIRFTDVRVPADHVLRKPDSQPHFTPLLATFQLTHSAIDIGIGRAALEAAKALVRGRSRVPPEALACGLSKPADDQHLLVTLGQWEARQRAAELLQADAAGRLHEAVQSLDRDRVDVAAIAVSAAKAFGADVALQIATDLFAFAGAGSTRQELGLDRFWRNLRVHSLHDANWWKYAQVGAYALDGTPPPVIGLQ